MGCNADLAKRDSPTGCRQDSRNPGNPYIRDRTPSTGIPHRHSLMATRRTNLFLGEESNPVRLWSSFAFARGIDFYKQAAV